ncbi:MAG: DUF4395 domain-containing protein [Bacteroidetes bacterium]|nr:DUF4395 domain-containing protein [Bacteroidota bacterium]
MEKALQLNEKVIRFNAFFTILTGIYILVFSNEWVGLFLAIDFLIRGFTNLLSPLTLLSKLIVRLLKLTPISVYAPPKKFAAKVGLLFSFLIFLFTFVQWEILTLVVATLLIICAFLEAFLKICVGCYVYNWFVVPVFFEKINKKGNVQ